jgi:predicted NACHT family NTPase
METRPKASIFAHLRSVLNYLMGKFFRRPKEIRSIEAGGDVVLGNLNLEAENLTLYINQATEQKFRYLQLDYSHNDLSKSTSRYLQYLIEKYKNISLKGLGGWVHSISVSLLRLYVPLQAIDPLQDLTIGNPRTSRVSLLKFIENHNEVIILGDPGSGKSTFLKYLTVNVALGQGTELKIEKHIPVYLPLIEYANYQTNGKINFEDFVQQYTKQISKDVWPVIKAAIDKGYALFLLDSLDEIKDLNMRNIVFEEIIDYFSINRNRVVITCRKIGYRAITRSANNFKEVEVASFDFYQIEQFLDNWLRAISTINESDAVNDFSQEGKEHINEIKNFIKTQRGVENLVSNPLMLTILALVKPDLKYLPQQKVLFYELLVKNWIRTWNRVRSNDIRFKNIYIDDTNTLNTLAFIAHYLNNQTNINSITVCLQNIWDRAGNLLRCSFPVFKIILRTVVSSATAFAAWFVS